MKQTSPANELYNIKEDFEMSQAEVCFQIETSIIDMQMNRHFNELYVVHKDRISDKKINSPKKQYKKRDLFQ